MKLGGGLSPHITSLLVEGDRGSDDRTEEFLYTLLVYCWVLWKQMVKGKLVIFPPNSIPALLCLWNQKRKGDIKNQMIFRYIRKLFWTLKNYFFPLREPEINNWDACVFQVEPLAQKMGKP